jgi:predicted methyltransferase
MKPRIPVGVALVVAGLAHLAAQQTALTAGQIKTAAVEVPQLVQLMELKPGMAIADVGAGFGAWTLAFARWTGPTGRVY